MIFDCCPCVSFFPDIKNLSVKEREDWMILDDQYFTFHNLTRIYAVTDLMRVWATMKNWHGKRLLQFPQQRRPAQICWIGAHHTFRHRHLELFEMFHPISGQVAVSIAPVHRSRFEKMSVTPRFIAVVIKKALVNQFRAIKRAIVGQEGVIVGLSYKRTGANQHRIHIV